MSIAITVQKKIADGRTDRQTDRHTDLSINYIGIIATDDDGLTDYRIKTGTPGLGTPKETI